jgi:hypothetical protein
MSFFIIAPAALTYFGVTAAVGSFAASLVGIELAVTGAAALAVGSGVVATGIGLAKGMDIGDAVKNGVVSGATSFVGSQVAGSVASSVAKYAATSTNPAIAGLSKEFGTIAGSMAGGATASGLTAAAYGGDPLKAMLAGGIGAGVGTTVAIGVDKFTKNINGFDKQPNYVQNAVKAALGTAIQGGDPAMAALTSGLQTVGQNVVDDFKTANAGGARGNAPIEERSTIIERATSALPMNQVSALQDDSGVLKGALSQYAEYQSQLTDYQKLVKQQELAQPAFEKYTAATQGQVDYIKGSIDKYKQAADAANAGDYGTANRLLDEIGQARYDADLKSIKAKSDMYVAFGNDAFNDNYINTVVPKENYFLTKKAILNGREETDLEHLQSKFGVTEMHLKDSVAGVKTQIAKINDGTDEIAKILNDTYEKNNAKLANSERNINITADALDRSLQKYYATEEQNATTLQDYYKKSIDASDAFKEKTGRLPTEQELGYFSTTSNPVEAAAKYGTYKASDVGVSNPFAYSATDFSKLSEAEQAAAIKYEQLKYSGASNATAAAQAFGDMSATTQTKVKNFVETAEAKATYADLVGYDPTTKSIATTIANATISDAAQKAAFAKDFVTKYKPDSYITAKTDFDKQFPQYGDQLAALSGGQVGVLTMTDAGTSTTTPLPSAIASKLDARAGETAGQLKAQKEEDGSITYSRVFSGKTLDGKDYAYVASYDPLDPKGVWYQDLGGSEITSGNLAGTTVIASVIRPTYNTAEQAAADAAAAVQQKALKDAAAAAAAAANAGTTGGLPTGGTGTTGTGTTGTGTTGTGTTGTGTTGGLPTGGTGTTGG